METFTKAEIAKIGKWVDGFVLDLEWRVFEDACYECGAGCPHLTKKQESLLDDIQKIRNEIGKLGKWQTRVVCDICGQDGIMELDGDDIDGYRCYPCNEKLSHEAFVRLWSKDIAMNSLRKPEHIFK